MFSCGMDVVSADKHLLGRVVENPRMPSLRGILDCAVHLFNDIRVISSLQQYTWDLPQGRTPLSEEVRRTMICKHRIAPWVCAGGFRGTPAQIKLTLRETDRYLKELARVHFVSERNFKFSRRHAALLQRATGIDIWQKAGSV